MGIREIAKFGQLPFIPSDENVEHSMNIIIIILIGEFIIDTNCHLAIHTYCQLGFLKFQNGGSYVT